MCISLPLKVPLRGSFAEDDLGVAYEILLRFKIARPDWILRRSGVFSSALA